MAAANRRTAVAGFAGRDHGEGAAACSAAGWEGGVGAVGEMVGSSRGYDGGAAGSGGMGVRVRVGAIVGMGVWVLMGEGADGESEESDSLRYGCHCRLCDDIVNASAFGMFLALLNENERFWLS